ncbi:hypothetical protein [Nocardia mexicana]|uniref:Uncharacterized protein n=1 Tax=Nocardia mexicana TaxID=279262 RepID=A0A370GKP6_9NOCA|nr:hypothetical protein [Nocardia mexicana]RDI42513.1 hypothetical protein DFR68_12651 [Nocardia mexicana]
MEWRTRVFDSPRGMLEVRVYEDESAEGGPGVYLEFRTEDTVSECGDRPCPEAS